jgi:hypothetical protein
VTSSRLESESDLRQVDVPRPSGRQARPRLDARTTAWLIDQRATIKRQELDLERLRGELAFSERIERGAQRYADRMEEKLEEARKRESTLARALGYAEAQRDELARRLKGAARSRQLRAK